MKKTQIFGTVLAVSAVVALSGCVTGGTTPYAGSKASSSKGSITSPSVSITNVEFEPAITVAKSQYGTEQLDVTDVDNFLTDASPNARHYPPNFPSKQQEYNTRQMVKHLASWIEPYATAPDASYDVLLRAAQLNGMARNLDMGSDYAVRASDYVARAIAIDSTAEANTLYGFLLAEGGGFKEGQKYLDRAIALGSTEAIQSSAQTDLMNDRRSSALQRLKGLQFQDPTNAIINEQIAIVESGKYYIWDIAAPNIDVQPLS